MSAPALLSYPITYMYIVDTYIMHKWTVHVFLLLPFPYLFDLLPGHLHMSTVEAEVMVEEEEVWLPGAARKNALKEVMAVDVIPRWLAMMVMELVEGEREGLSVSMECEPSSTVVAVMTRGCVHLPIHVIMGALSLIRQYLHEVKLMQCKHVHISVHNYIYMHVYMYIYMYKVMYTQSYDR